MNKETLTALLTAVAQGKLTVEEAVTQCQGQPFIDLGYAKPDLHRGVRQGVPEVIYGGGKTAEQMAGIISAMEEKGEKTILITRLEKTAAQELQEQLPLQYFPIPKIGLIGEMPQPTGNGKIVVAAAGTSDLPVAEEAAITAQMLGNQVERLYDVGVAGLHRLLAYLPTLQSAQVVVAVAGMEGALASVIGGLVSCPVVAVPTSVGYGASFGGVSALLSMLNSCASGVSVVNIDNGFGAAFQASLINHLGGKR